MKNQVKILGSILKRNELKNVQGAVGGLLCAIGYTSCGAVCCNISTSYCWQDKAQMVCTCKIPPNC
ncbi:MAG: hypothetical protein QM528_03605 [Phycisphaerales bacterium]|nr:hypothetical protein [Phycisphaerales bacterium]